MAKRLRVGIIGGGLGGLAAAIATARTGADVTVLEAATELGEIGAGIHIFPNASRFLLRWGVDELIGDNLVQHDEANTWSGGPGLHPISKLDAKAEARKCGFPWYIVRRDHLHAGLAQSARQHGAKIIVNARITSFDDTTSSTTVTVHTTPNNPNAPTPNPTYTFDLLIAADGIKSAIRAQLFPSIHPIRYGPACAYRHTLQTSHLLQHIPEAEGWFSQQLNMWCGPHGYLVTYPLSGGREVNITVCFYTSSQGCDRNNSSTWPTTIVENADLSELHEQLKAYPEIVQKMWSLVPSSNRTRWPLLHIPVHKLPSFGNDKGNVVLMGDACHAMNPALAQGAATAIEDAAFLGHVVGEVQKGYVSINEATKLYEERRRPKAWMKQMNAFVGADIICGGPGPSWLREKGGSSKGINGEAGADSDGAGGGNAEQVWNVNGESTATSEYTYSYDQVRSPRDAFIHNQQLQDRSWHQSFEVEINPRHFYYDAEADADDAVAQYLLRKGGLIDDRRGTVDLLERKFWGGLFPMKDEAGKGGGEDSGGQVNGSG